MLFNAHTHKKKERGGDRSLMESRPIYQEEGHELLSRYHLKIRWGVTNRNITKYCQVTEGEFIHFSQESTNQVVKAYETYCDWKEKVMEPDWIIWSWIESQPQEYKRNLLLNEVYSLPSMQ